MAPDGMGRCEWRALLGSCFSPDEYLLYIYLRSSEFVICQSCREHGKLYVCGFRPPHGDWAMRMRFWGENTRDGEKSVSLSLGVFIGASNVSPRAFHPKARSHFPITALCSQACAVREYAARLRQTMT